MEIQVWLDNSNSLFHQIFMIVMGGLYGVSFLFGTTYNVVNIFVYYLLIPSSWIYLISRKTSYWLNLISLGLLMAFSLLPNIRTSCDYFFQQSVDFLNWTAEIFDSNYIDMSVHICVTGVGIIYLILILFTLTKKIAKITLITTVVIFVLYMILVYPNFKDLMLFGLEKTGVQY
ncbi:hypothetical protein LV84_03103 [Algoriphagus ratkowskyi]|uniref:Uncharacterized protein n=1 Tax=Algoriphagus ratkowskyi TaxID=57028 RepID=A0A2W7RGF9_9BACT|nr:hypothetical protein [Algoriphagus ratkowskyi]PZX53379.1 hypothetical protein LV84_03103 [Algoriphagus ratkowskyi]TXD76576.1 hypothetical protein ESW18_16380 [Algoriphagus ratkowskyi]